MPEPTATAAVEAAEAAEILAPPSDGATPPKAEVPAPQDSKQTPYEQALAALNDAGDIRQREEGSGDVIGKMLGERPSVMDRLAEASRDPLAQEEAPPDETPVVETTDPNPVDPPAEAAPVDETPAEVELTDKRLRANINAKKPDGTFVNSERTRAAMTLSHERKIDYEEAWTSLFGERQPASEKSAQAAPAKPEPTAAEIDVQIKDLEKQIEEAEDVTFNDDLARKLNRQLRALLPQRQDALFRDLQRQQAQRETQQTVEQQVNASEDRAVALYPDAAKPGSPLHGALTKRIEYLQKIGSPIFNEPDWPETLAAEQANRLGTSAKVAAPAKAVAAKPAAPPVPKRPATPVPSPGSVSGPAPAQLSRVDSLRQRMNDAKAKGDWNALQALGAEIGAAA